MTDQESDKYKLQLVLSIVTTLPSKNDKHLHIIIFNITFLHQQQLSSTAIIGNSNKHINITLWHNLGKNLAYQ